MLLTATKKLGILIAKPKKETQKMKTIKTPKYWQDKLFQPLIEVKTAYGNKVKIPKMYFNGWQTAKMEKAEAERLGLDILDGLERDREINSLYYDLERVFYEIYE